MILKNELNFKEDVLLKAQFLLVFRKELVCTTISPNLLTIKWTYEKISVT